MLKKETPRRERDRLPKRRSILDGPCAEVKGARGNAGPFPLPKWGNFGYNSSMVDAQVQTELLKQLDQLPIAQQQRVLDFARSLSRRHRKPLVFLARELLKFAGTISPEDCKAMMEAIEEGCEQIDYESWQ